jgi:ribosomal protein L40E
MPTKQPYQPNILVPICTICDAPFMIHPEEEYYIAERKVNNLVCPHCNQRSPVTEQLIRDCRKNIVKRKWATRKEGKQ